MNNDLYHEGFSMTMQDIADLGYDGARDKFNEDYPFGEKIRSARDLELSKGRIDALRANKI